jgi:hypothetical protein
MNSRLNDRLKKLEAEIAPKGRHVVFVRFEEPDAPSRDEQLADLKITNCVTPSDHLHEVTVTFS